jgi:hypothetical protein
MRQVVKVMNISTLKDRWIILATLFLLLTILTIPTRVINTSQVAAQSNCSQPNTSIGSGDFQVSAVTEGEYRIWFRVAAPTDEARFMLKVNDGCHKEVTADNNNKNTLAWHSAYSDSSKVRVNLKKGLNRLEVVGVTDSLEIDQVILSENDCIPTGNGLNCVEVDRVDPVVAIIDPSNGAVISEDIDMHAVVTDDDTNLEVNFFIDDVLYSSADKNGMAEWFVQFQATSIEAGEHELRVEAKDSSGNVGSSSVMFELQPSVDVPQQIPTIPEQVTDAVLDNEVITLLPSDDTFARSDKPDESNENSTLHTDVKPGKIIYIRYAIPENYQVSKANLSLYPLTNAENGGTIYRTESDWREDSLTWNNRPSISTSSVNTIGAVEKDKLVNIDVSSGINPGDRFVSFAISSNSDELARYNSKEKNSQKTGPFLVLTGAYTGREAGSPSGENTEGQQPGETAPPPITSNNPFQNYVFTVKEDSFVRQDQPNETAETNTLHIDSKPRKIIYLKFDASEVKQKQIDSIKLRIYAIQGGGSGGEIHTTDNTSWTEKALNWNNRPNYNSEVLATLGAVSEDKWYEVDLSTFTIPDSGILTINIVGTEDETVRYQSKDKESGSYAAELLIRAR